MARSWFNIHRWPVLFLWGFSKKLGESLFLCLSECAPPLTPIPKAQSTVHTEMIYSEPLLLPCSINTLLQKLASCCSGELLLTSSLSSTGKKKKHKLLPFYFNSLLYVSLESGRRFGKQVRNIKLAALLQLTVCRCAAQPGDYAAVSSAMQSWSLLLTTSTCLQN